MLLRYGLYYSSKKNYETVSRFKHFKTKMLQYSSGYSIIVHSVPLPQIGLAYKNSEQI